MVQRVVASKPLARPFKLLAHPLGLAHYSTIPSILLHTNILILPERELEGRAYWFHATFKQSSRNFLWPWNAIP
eukprot:335015-Pelagomonas_calceolata.AAC.3